MPLDFCLLTGCTGFRPSINVFANPMPHKLLCYQSVSSSDGRMRQVVHGLKYTFAPRWWYYWPWGVPVLHHIEESSAEVQTG